eukprot:CAMPEP_0172668088 /NCGR_PEP_ID=MMETSP1074-20121228/8842_1 /TAXON_ID=2916 /ORGANISM="Ceratium fusus, Strain PA161109" /LENGTH=328 /DNA_ID=CAMNT_0013484695 /DNA_START=82 /DNA_END=1064 /DNA_ORIENTATION=+
MASRYMDRIPTGYGDAVANHMEHPSMYGAMDKICASGYPRRQRKRMNLLSMALALFVPWLLFVTVFAAMSFSLHYQSPEVAYFIAGLCMLLVITFGTFAVTSLRNGTATEVGHGANWYIFIFLTALLAWCLGVAFGDVNFTRNMQPYYDMTNLNVYPAVDVTRMRGQQLMDAGRMVFLPRSQLDLRYAMSFRNTDMYCVAPVAMRETNGSVPRLVNYDFWAVGINCCSGDGSDFHCGQSYNDKTAHAGLRLMRDSQRPFFRLAVQQSLAAFNLKATHPIFLHWVADPILAMKEYEENGFKSLLLGMFSHFSLQLCLVAAAAVGFARLG